MHSGSATERRARGRTGTITGVVLALVAVVALLFLQLSSLPDRTAVAPDATERPVVTPTPTRTVTPTPVATPTPAATLTPAAAPTPAPTPTASTPHPVPATLLGTDWEVLPTEQKVVALTFDAGANADAVAAILATLAAEDVVATFFVTGDWVTRYPDEAARIGGTHPLGNHSYSHPHFTELNDEQIREELTRTQRAIYDATGRDDRPWFRFPFGDRDERTVGVVNDAGYGSIRWTVDTLGWKGTSEGMTADAVVQRVLDTQQPGQIVLMHVGSHPTDGSMLDADALPRIIRELRDRGYEFVTLPEFG